MPTPKASKVPIAELVNDPKAFLDDVIDTGIRSPNEAATRRGEMLIANFVDELVKRSGLTVSKSATRAINEWIAEIDGKLSNQLNAIMHAPEFQQLESSWRGLHQLVMQTETGENMQIRVLNVSKKDLLKDFQAAAEFTESALWKKIYEYEFGLYGGDPFGALVGDFEFGKHPQDIELLDHVSHVAAAAHAPFLGAASSEMFGMESYTQMPDPRALERIFDKANPENTKWLALRNESEDSRFVALTLPHVLMRLPYGRATQPVEAFNFEEDVDGVHKNYLWGNAAYSLAGRMTDAFAHYHWCARIRGPEGGGAVEGLPIHVFKSREGDIGSKCPTEVLIPDTRSKELEDLGFVPLVYRKNSDNAAFFATNSIQRPKKYDDPDATANAKLSSQLEYLLVSCRIAHYLKAICRDKVGSFMSKQDCQNFLTRWIEQYVLLNDTAPEEQKAAHPLREAQITVTDDRARPGCYKAVVHLKPHFHLDEINVALRLVAELPPAVKK